MIDWKRLCEMHRELGDPDFRAILDLFLDEIEDAVMRLDTVPPDGLGTRLHVIKGSAWTIGLAEFGRLCQSCETQVMRGRADQVRTAALTDSYAMSRQILMRDLDRVLGGQAGAAVA